ncbi:MAG: SPOR domain-containing protein [Methylocystis sp.]|nr:SPOR domain-containing protein [Methylocystis sp.]MCA3584029.1 SPOR domain-containing protein [Methylocystis sp.]MCA3586673.1 SPOR domain-containing protein [Methylocystis sp.]MCA3591643.1 SPOR domain-containing protein [Methylocystis sp.]
MKHDRPSASPIDFEELDRQLAAQGLTKRTGGDDPLAELARIVGHEDMAAGGANRGPRPGDDASRRFDDFLRLSPIPASGAAEAQAPSFDPLLAADDLLRPLPQTGQLETNGGDHQFDDLLAHPESATGSAPESSYEDALADLGLRSALPAEVASNPAKIDDRTPIPVSREQDFDFDTDDLAPRAPQLGLSVSEGGKTTAAGFEDMLAEFEAAMRDAGGERAAAPAQPLAPALAPSPPDELAGSGRGDESSAAAAAAGAAAAMSAGAAAAHPSRSRRGMLLAAGVVGIAVIGVASLLALGTGPNTGVNRDAPVIAAKPGLTKERPANPGGMDMPNQDKEVLQPRGADTRQGERVVPREEQPLDLTQAQRSAESQAQNGVRQIPGVSQITPNASAPTPAVPRPVASVPITISGPPPGSSQAAPIGMPSMSLPPQVSGPNPSFAQSVIPAAPAPPPSAPAAPAAPAAAPPAPPAAAPSASAAAAEPRRVRAVPIRPDEAAPSRAQAQPRVVPTPQRPAADTLASAAVDDANGPLRITPQAVRAAPPRVPAAQASSTVPTSMAAPSATQSAPAAAASPGSGFSVQLAAEGSEEAARSKFNRLRTQYGDVLSSLNPVIRNAEVNGRSIYRVRVGNMSREEASGLCERLKADGGSCFVARN